MITHKMCHHLKIKPKDRVGLSLLKIEIAKAYDRVEWEFLHFMIQALGFSKAWVQLIIMCVSKLEYCIHIDGMRTMPFKPYRGLHHGDPLSPCLFLICD